MSYSQALFVEFSRHAVDLKLIDAGEVRLIARVGTRKANYWSRHLRDLLNILADRIDALPAEAFDDDRHLENLANAVQQTMAKVYSAR